MKGVSYAAVATHGSRRTFRCHQTQDGRRTGSRPGRSSRLDGGGSAQSIGFFVSSRHVRCPPCLAVSSRRRGCGPSYEQGTWAEQVVVPLRNIVPLSGDADPLQLSMLGINPATAYLLLSRYVSLMPGDWIGQTAANSAMGQYIIKFAKLAGVKTLNVVRREEAADQVRQFGGDHVVLQGDKLQKEIEEALGGKKLSLVLDTVGGTPVGDLAKSLKTGGSVVVYGMQSGQFPAVSPK